MILAAHQLHYLPWLRYFHKILLCDVFLVLDDVQYTKNGWQNRNKIKTDRGTAYLTVPVRAHMGDRICDVPIADKGFAEKHARTLKQYYRKAPFFETCFYRLSPCYEEPVPDTLAAMSRSMLSLWLELLGITTPVYFSSELGLQQTQTFRLIEACRRLGADAYLTGAHALGAYLDQQAFREAGIRLLVQKWEAPVYRQLFAEAGFVPDLAVVDLLMNEGDKSAMILQQSGGLEPCQP